MKLFYSLLLFFLSSCSSKDTPNSRERTRLQENTIYAQCLFQDEAPERLPLPIEKKQLSLSVLDALFIQQAKPCAPNSSCETVLNNILLSSPPGTIHIKKLSKTSPYVIQGCHEAFVLSRLSAVKLSHLVFPELLGIEIERTPNPAIYLIERYEEGIPFSQLLSDNNVFSLLGQALGELHATTLGEKSSLHILWQEAILALSERIVHQYSNAPESLKEASLITTQYLRQLLFSFVTKKSVFLTSYTLGSDLDGFSLLKDSSILCTNLTNTGSSIVVNKEGTACGIPLYDYSRLYHHITLFASQHLPEKAVRQIQKNFDLGYMRSMRTLPEKEELRFFLLIDLFDKIDKSDSSIPRSLLEQELLTWSKMVKKCTQ